MRFVPIKSAEQLDLQALHRIRSRLVGHRTAVINQLRRFLLECGVIVPQGPARLREILPSVLAQRTDVFSPRMIRLIEELADDWRRLDDRVDVVTSEVHALARQDECCRRLTSVPGIGALTASAVVATIGNGAAFSRGATSELGSGWCRSNSHNGEPRLVLMRWGLVPSWWSKPPKELKLATFNALGDIRRNPPHPALISCAGRP
jgi:transposase